MVEMVEMDDGDGAESVCRRDASVGLEGTCLLTFQMLSFSLYTIFEQDLLDSQGKFHEKASFNNISSFLYPIISTKEINLRKISVTCYDAMTSAEKP